MTSDGGKPAMQPRSNKKRKQENRKMEDALTYMIRASAKSRQEETKNMNQDKTVEEVFFETCSFANEKTSNNHKICHTTKTIAVVCVNAENPQLPPIPTTPLATNTPQINAYCGPSASQGENNAHNAHFSATTSPCVETPNHDLESTQLTTSPLVGGNLSAHNI